ncbi:hypothetical protein GCM10009551_062540 [Nocardiopsis tropica]
MSGARLRGVVSTARVRAPRGRGPRNRGGGGCRDRASSVGNTPRFGPLRTVYPAGAPGGGSIPVRTRNPPDARGPPPPGENRGPAVRGADALAEGAGGAAGGVRDAVGGPRDPGPASAGNASGVRLPWIAPAEGARRGVTA